MLHVVPEAQQILPVHPVHHAFGELHTLAAVGVGVTVGSGNGVGVGIGVEVLQNEHAGPE